MTTADASTSARDADATRQMPDWDNFIPPEPDPPDDGLAQEEPHLRLRLVLFAYYHDWPDVLVSGGKGYYFYDRCDIDAKFAPDLTIAFGVDVKRIRARNAYMIWEVGKPPDFAMEIATRSTADIDNGAKRDLYAKLGIGEYWRMDPTGGDLYGDPLIGEYLVDGEYRRYPVHENAERNIVSHSEALNLDFYWDGKKFGIYDSATGERKLDLVETIRAHDALAEKRQVRDAAEAAKRLLREELDLRHNQ